jgi:hypothetical protein
MVYGLRRAGFPELIRYIFAEVKLWKRELVMILKLSHVVGVGVYYQTLDM